jgi:zinc protease
VRRSSPLMVWILTLAAAGAALAATPTTEVTLDNGLRVILIPHHANPMVASAVVVASGVTHEPAKAAGASHFLEHLLFNGTTSRSQKQLYDDVDRLGAYNNATTREDHTLFTMLAAKDLAEKALAIQADMLFDSTIPAENFDKERKIVLEELSRDRSDPDYDTESAFRAFAFAGTPIARPVLGTEATLTGIARADVLAYYKDRYVPGNMTLVVMGDFAPDDMLALVKRTFGRAPRGTSKPAPAAAWPARPGANLATAKAEGSPDRVLAAFPVDIDPYDPRATAISVLLSAASEGEDAPLRVALTSRGVPAEDATLSLERRVRPLSTVVLDARIDAASDPAKVLDAMAEAIRATRAGGAARARLARFVSQAASDGVLARDQILYFPMLRSDRIIGSPKGFLDAEPTLAAALPPSTWDAAAELLVKGLGFVRARATGAGRADGATRWEPPAETAPPKAAADLVAGALGNGLRYVVSRSDDSDVFAVHVAFVPRSAAEPEGKDGITDLLHRAMIRATEVHEAAALEARLSAIGARIKGVDDPSVPFDDYYTTPEFSWLRAEAPATAWRETVSLLAEMIRFPKIDAAGVDEAKKTMARLVAKRDGSARETAAERLDALLAPGHPLTHRVLGTSASVASIGLDDLVRFQKAFATGGRMIVTVAGPVATSDVVAALSADLGGLSAGDPPPSAPPVPRSAVPGVDEATLGKPQAAIALGTVIEFKSEDLPALVVAVAMLSDRLAFDLRETRGLAYSVDSTLRPWGDAWRWDLQMGTRPENIAEAVDGLRQGASAFREAEIRPEDVARTINAVRGRALMRRMTRISLAYEAGMEVMRGEAAGDERRMLEALALVSADDVKRVASRYLDPARLSRVVVH